jgi:hypothetical protein
MASYYEALPIYKAAMDVAVRIDAVVQRFAKVTNTRRVGACARRRAGASF